MSPGRNVTADAAALCLKSGNAVILRGGSEAIHSNQAIAACVHQGLREAGLPEAAVQVVNTTDRAAVGELITLTGMNALRARCARSVPCRRAARSHPHSRSG